MSFENRGDDVRLAVQANGWTQRIHREASAQRRGFVLLRRTPFIFRDQVVALRPPVPVRAAALEESPGAVPSSKPRHILDAGYRLPEYSASRDALESAVRCGRRADRPQTAAAALSCGVVGETETSHRATSQLGNPAGTQAPPPPLPAIDFAAPKKSTRPITAGDGIARATKIAMMQQLSGVRQEIYGTRVATPGASSGETRRAHPASHRANLEARLALLEATLRENAAVRKAEQQRVAELALMVTQLKL